MRVHPHRGNKKDCGQTQTGTNAWETMHKEKKPTKKR
jgi:hypothetical protein